MEFILSYKNLEGVISKKRNVSAFSLNEIEYSPGVLVSAHAHEDANFCMAVEGGCTEIYEHRTREYKPFSLGFLPPLQTHSLKASGQGMRAFSINITPSWLGRMREHSLKVDDSLYCSGGLLTQLMTRLYREYQNPDEASPLAVEGIALEMLAEVSRYQITCKQSAPPRWLRQARDIVHEQFSLSLSLERIACEVGVHPVHLARMFRRYYRCAIGEYIRRVRIENACRSMIATDIPLIEIALENGFSDQSHFTRIFKRFKGMTPAEYRSGFRPR